jgi:hypothetical protein
LTIQSGIPIDCNGRLGTLGLIVKGKDNHQLYLLSCWHLLDGGEGQSEIRSPLHNNTVIAHYNRSQYTSRPDLDVAIAELNFSSDLAYNNGIHGTNRVVSRAAYAVANMELRKVGAATGITQCRLEKKLDRLGNLKYGMLLKAHTNGLSFYCDRGDSGAIWCSMTGKAIGLHTKGGLADNRAAAVPLKVILNLMKVSIV